VLEQSFTYEPITEPDCSSELGKGDSIGAASVFLLFETSLLIARKSFILVKYPVFANRPKENVNTP
jgi:hypothetical protein